MGKILLFVLFVLGTAPALADATDWVDVAPQARMRLLFSGVRSADDTTMMALELDMQGVTMTYWRVPGETGVPLALDTTGSTGIGDLEVIWPYPELETRYGYVDHVYHGNLVLPISVKLQGDSPRLQLNMIMGVCSDVCVPVSVDVSHDLDFSRRDASADLRIRQTMVNAPIPWQGAEAPIGEASYDPAGERLEVEIRDPDLDISSMIATLDGAFTVFSPPQKSPIPGIVTFQKLGGGKVEEMAGQDVIFTFMSADGPYEITRKLKLAD